MNYKTTLENGGCSLLFKGHLFLRNLKVKARLMFAQDLFFSPREVISQCDCTTILFEKESGGAWQKETEYVSVVLRELDHVLLISMDTQANRMANSQNYAFQPQESLTLCYDMAFPVKESLAWNCNNPYWTNTEVNTLRTGSGNLLQGCSFTDGKTHVHMLPLVCDCFTARISREGLRLDTGVCYHTHLCGPVALISFADDPYAAMEQAFRAGKKAGAIHVALREDRTFPEALNGFGWCTWDAFYRDVNSSSIYQKLEEFKEKKIPVRWLLIDDGWSQYTGETNSATNEETPDPNKLLDYGEDRSKFPEGLKATVQTIKGKYGVHDVGVWQALTGYWFGISRDGALYKEHPDRLYETPTGYCVPGETPEKAYAFWDGWHAYLEEQGIDFVKIDLQNAYPYKAIGELGPAKAMRIQMEAVERSVEKHFSGAIINCMGNDMQSGFVRPLSCINRNSNDFHPTVAGDFSRHIVQNAYNSLLNGQLYVCDYDMFWTTHETAVVSAVLRAISGGPLYVCDPLGKSDATIIRCLADDEGNTFRLDCSAIPTRDCFYHDCVSENLPLKLMNRAGENFVVAAFGITEGKRVAGNLKLSDIPDAKGGRYFAREHFSGKTALLDKDTEIPLSLEDGDLQVWSLYPIQDGLAKVGNPRYYAEIATPVYEEIQIR